MHFVSGESASSLICILFFLEDIVIYSMTRGDNIDKRGLLSNAENMQNKMQRATILPILSLCGPLLKTLP